jgi:putative phosphoserine phosphatase/1-acylglycerol-3-phosphate O-acyltransferase
MIIKPATVDFAVLEPIPTDDRTVDDLEARVAEIRQKFVDTIDDRPKPGEVP